jgi:hypothetical protein
MNAYATSDSQFGRHLEDLIDSVHAEIRHAVTYTDRVIVPEVRREAGTAARLLAGHLERLADRLHPQPASDPNSPGRDRGL